MAWWLCHQGGVETMNIVELRGHGRARAMILALIAAGLASEVRRVTSDVTRNAWAPGTQLCLPRDIQRALYFTNMNGRRVQAVVMTCPGIDEGTTGPEFWVGLDDYPHPDRFTESHAALGHGLLASVTLAQERYRD
jgi:hypothetical protein